MPYASKSQGKLSVKGCCTPDEESKALIPIAVISAFKQVKFEKKV